MECCAFIDVMGWAREKYGCAVETVTGAFSRRVISTFGVPVLVDRTIDEIEAGGYDALAVPGGFEEYGFYEEAYDERFLDLIRAFDAAGKPVAAVCVAALAVGKSGILQGRAATTYPLNGGRRRRQLRDFGARVIDNALVRDGNVITSQGPESAPHVAFALLEVLTSKEKTDAVRAAMGFPVESA